MPLYDYRCVSCGKVVEVRHGFDEQHKGTCPTCGGALERVFNAAPIHFKGSGFYVTDSRAKKSGESKSGESKSGEPKKSEEPKKTDDAKKSESTSKDSKPGSESAA